jgi:hypothetical protein
VLLISGSMGSGKTTVLGEASDILADAGIRHAALDLDALGTRLLPDEAARDLTLRNLAGIYANVIAAGLTHILLAEAVDTKAEILRLRHAMPGGDLMVCRLTASLDTMERRLRIREPGVHQEQFVSRSRTLHETLEEAHLEDFTIPNDGRSITDVAREMLRRAEWLL